MYAAFKVLPPSGGWLQRTPTRGPARHHSTPVPTAPAWWVAATDTHKGPRPTPLHPCPYGPRLVGEAAFKLLLNLFYACCESCKAVDGGKLARHCLRSY